MRYGSKTTKPHSDADHDGEADESSTMTSNRRGAAHVDEAQARLRTRATHKRALESSFPSHAPAAIDLQYSDSHGARRPVYHRHYPNHNVVRRHRQQQQQHPRQQQQQQASRKHQRFVLLLPILLFGTITALAILQPPPSSLAGATPQGRLESSSAMNQMLQMYSNQQQLRRPQFGQRQRQDHEEQVNGMVDEEKSSIDELSEEANEEHNDEVEDGDKDPAENFPEQDEHEHENPVINPNQQQNQIDQQQDKDDMRFKERPVQNLEQQQQQEQIQNTQHKIVDVNQVDKLKSNVTTTKVVLDNNTHFVVWNDAATQSWPQTTDNSITLFLQTSQGTTATAQTAKDYPLGRTSEDICQSNTWPATYLPINNFPEDDPFLPWIHDFWFEPSEKTRSKNYNGRIQFVAQNRRRCHTGKGNEEIMKHWEPQMSLFQTIPLFLEQNTGLGSNVHNHTIRVSDSVETATIPETRFVCHFHRSKSSGWPAQSFVTFSEFNFNYEYVLWRKRAFYKSMFVETGRDVEQFELSSLLFSCPVPRSVTAAAVVEPDSWKLDLIPIRTRARRDREMLMTLNHVGPEYYAELADNQKGTLVLSRENRGKVPLLQMLLSSGRWAGLPICWNALKGRVVSSDEEVTSRGDGAQQLLSTGETSKSHYFVACTWTAANYFRRGDATAIRDSAKRLREWITFHRIVGLDHVYVYDNTRPPEGHQNSSQAFESPLKEVIEKYFADGFATYIPWPCEVCSNNRPNHPNPGERSSQYGAEASCRERYGPQTEWMAFIDIDEYLVPMMRSSDEGKRLTSWKPILEQKVQENQHVLKMRSSRGKPRVELMETIYSDTENVCIATGSSKFPQEPCIRPLPSQTLLRVYNCEYIRPPKPERFQRAMKQIYRPAWVKSHYVHYSTITKPMTEYYEVRRTSTDPKNGKYEKVLEAWEWGDTFLDELEEGCLSHSKSIVPHETMYRSSICKLESKQACPLGYQCPDSTEFVDKLHQKNVFTDLEGKYCNCWINHHLEDTLIPLLEAELATR